MMFANHGGGNVIYAVANEEYSHVVASRGELWKTTNRGAGWAMIDTHGPAQRGYLTSISVPYIDESNPDQWVYWGRGGHVAIIPSIYRVSSDQGASFATLPNTDLQYAKIGTSGNQNRLFILADRPDLRNCKYSLDGGVSYTTLPLIVAANEAFSSFTEWQGNHLLNVLLGSTPTAGAPGNVRMYYWVSGSPSWLDKTGNLDSLGPTEVREIQRDSMGSA
jgi:hypothetical protein